MPATAQSRTAASIIARYDALKQLRHQRTIEQLHNVRGLPRSDDAFRQADIHDQVTRDILTRHYVIGFRLTWRANRELQRIEK